MAWHESREWGFATLHFPSRLWTFRAVGFRSIPPRRAAGVWGVVLWLGSLQCIEECGCVRASCQPLWMYFLITTQPCLKSGHGRFCRRVHVLVLGSKVSMLPSAGPSLLTMPPVVYIFPSRTTALKHRARARGWESDFMQNCKVITDTVTSSSSLLRYNGSFAGSYMTTHPYKSGKAVRTHSDRLLG